MTARFFGLLVLGLAACSGSETPPACGLNALVGSTVLLDEFSRPNQTLSTPPAGIPERLVARLVAGPAYSAISGRADSQLVIGVNGTLPPKSAISFGVLVLDTSGKALGVMLYESPLVDGAPTIGSVTAGSVVVPLIGIQLDPQRIQDPACPLFPDSLAR